jgi:hypothetical protein
MDILSLKQLNYKRMKKHLFLSLFMSLIVLSTQAQDQAFHVKISYDSVYIGNALKIQYTIKNIKGEFQQPDLHGFHVISGPNISNSFSLVNGSSNSEKSYSYLIVPQETGTFEIQPAYFQTKDTLLQTSNVTFEVLDNPNKIVQDPEEMQFFPFLKDTPTPPMRPEKPKRPLKKT